MMINEKPEALAEGFSASTKGETEGKDDKM